tara:strand:+ start:1104 stop:1502 length:399 start_codon:yes stop_codon:yes gene_type:complete
MNYHLGTETVNLFKKYNVKPEEFKDWLKKNETQPNPDLEIKTFKKNFMELNYEPGELEYMLDKYKEEEEIKKHGYNRNIKDDNDNIVYRELGVKRHGGKRKRKTLKRKKSVRKSKKSRKGRKSKKSRKTRRR